MRVDAAEARRVAEETRQSMPIQLADGLEVTVWAPKQLVADALALDVDANGVVYVDLDAARQSMAGHPPACRLGT